MTSGRYGLVLREVGRLLGGGSASGLEASRLLERFAADRDGAAFEALVGRHGPMVLGTCRRMLSDPHDVDDAFQATFLVLARRAGSIRDADRLGPWLHGVARRVAARSRALASRRRSVEGRGGDDLPAAESPDALEVRELREALDEELARLPEKYRAPLVLCYLEGLTHDEAARQLAWPVGTVRSRLAGARDRLRSALTRRGLAPPAALPAILPHASIPPALLTTTVRVATSAGSPPAHVLALAKGALIAMSWNQWKMIAALGLMAGLTVGGAGVAAQQGGPGKAEARVEEPPAIEQIQQEREQVQAQILEVTRALEKIRHDQAVSLPKLEAKLAALKSQSDALEGRWKELAASTSDNPRDRVAGLEKVVADQAALIRSLNARRADSPGAPADKPTAHAVPADPPKGGASPKEAVRAEVPKPSAAGVEPVGNQGTPEHPPMVLQLGDGRVMVIPGEQDRATVLNPATGGRSTQRFPRGVNKVTPVMSSGLVALMLKGPEVRQVAAYDIQGWTWYPQELKEPTTEASPIVGVQDVTYVLGRFIYIFSIQAKKWAVLELRRDPGRGTNVFGGVGGMQGGRMMIPEGDLIHIYDPKTGEWTHMDTKDDQ